MTSTFNSFGVRVIDGTVNTTTVPSDPSSTIVATLPLKANKKYIIEANAIWTDDVSNVGIGAWIYATGEPYYIAGGSWSDAMHYKGLINFIGIIKPSTNMNATFNIAQQSGVSRTLDSTRLIFRAIEID